MVAYQLRLKVNELVDGSPSGKKFTSSLGLESKPAHRVTLPEGKKFQSGCIVFSVSPHSQGHIYCISVLFSVIEEAFSGTFKLVVYLQSPFRTA